MAQSAAQPAAPRTPSPTIEARASNEYRLKRLAIVVMLVACSLIVVITGSVTTAGQARTLFGREPR